MLGTKLEEAVTDAVEMVKSKYGCLHSNYEFYAVMKAELDKLSVDIENLEGFFSKLWEYIKENDLKNDELDKALHTLKVASMDTAISACLVTAVVSYMIQSKEGDKNE